MQVGGTGQALRHQAAAAARLGCPPQVPQADGAVVAGREQPQQAAAAAATVAAAAAGIAACRRQELHFCDPSLVKLAREQRRDGGVGCQRAGLRLAAPPHAHHAILAAGLRKGGAQGEGCSKREA